MWQKFVKKNADKAKFGQVDIDDQGGMDLALEHGVLDEGIPSIWAYDRTTGEATKVGLLYVVLVPSHDWVMLCCYLFLSSSSNKSTVQYSTFINAIEVFSLLVVWRGSFLVSTRTYVTSHAHTPSPPKSDQSSARETPWACSRYIQSVT